MVFNFYFVARQKRCRKEMVSGCNSVATKTAEKITQTSDGLLPFGSSSKSFQPTPHLYVCKLKTENGKYVKLYVPSICQSFVSFLVQTALIVYF